MENVILVDKNDKEIGLAEKVQAHLGNGKLHRAFLVFIFNKKNETLVQRRNGKMLWPKYWDSACASHPRIKESYVTAGERRLAEELGFTCTLKQVDSFIYQENFNKVGSEYEYCVTLIGEYEGPVKPNKEEVADWKWISIPKLKKDIKENSDKYTPWFKIALKRLIKEGKI